MIDSSRKRASIINYSLPAGRVLPAPDGAIALPDRARLVGLYVLFDIIADFYVTLTGVFDIVVSGLCSAFNTKFNSHGKFAISFRLRGDV